MQTGPIRYPAHDLFRQLLHWSMVALLFVQWGLAEYADGLAQQDKLAFQLQTLALHKSFGITLLVLLLLRVAWRLFKPHPATPGWQRIAANSVHYLFYLLLLSLPLTGWLGSSASAYTVTWFGFVELPDLIQPDPDAKKVLYRIHEMAWNLLIGLALLHIAAALKHRFFDQDNVLQSMFRPFGWMVVSIIWLIGGGVIYWSMQPGESAKPPVVAQPEPAQELIVDQLPEAWRIDYANSFIRFVADQAGAEFSGEFSQWTGRIHIDPAKPGHGLIDVTVNPASVETLDQERDDLLKDGDFFAVAQFPEARFVGQRFSLNQDQSVLLDASLSMRGINAPVQLVMSLKEQNGRYELTGEAVLDRFVWQLGTGEWSDVSTIGRHVKVMVKVLGVN